MVTEPSQPTDGNQTKIDYQQDIPMDFQQQRSQTQTESNSGVKQLLGKPDNADPKSFQPNSDTSGPPTDQYKNSQPSRPYGPSYDGGMQRFPEGMMHPSTEQTQYPPTGPMANTNNSTSTANTPTLNQLLSQSPASQKYAPGYADFPNANTGNSGATQTVYDNWNATPAQQGSNPTNSMRPSMPSPNRMMPPNSAQVKSRGSTRAFQQHSKEYCTSVVLRSWIGFCPYVNNICNC